MQDCFAGKRGRGLEAVSDVSGSPERAGSVRVELRLNAGAEGKVGLRAVHRDRRRDPDGARPNDGGRVRQDLSGLASRADHPLLNLAMAAAIAWTIRRAEAGDAEALPAIENSAGTLFRDLREWAWLADGEDLPTARYRELIAGGASWVAVDIADNPVAFLNGSVEQGELHIWELGVRRDLQRRGLGRALLHAAIREAHWHGLVAVTLTTFREIPWNAPFYERLGFERLESDAVGARLEEALQADVERGLPADARCAMRLRLGWITSMV